MTLIVPRQIAARWGGAGDVVASVGEPIKRTVTRLPGCKHWLDDCRCSEKRTKLNRFLTFKPY